MAARGWRPKRAESHSWAKSRLISRSAKPRTTAARLLRPSLTVCTRGIISISPARSGPRLLRGRQAGPRPASSSSDRKYLERALLGFGIRRAVRADFQGFAAALHRRCRRVRTARVGQNRALFHRHGIRRLLFGASRGGCRRRRATRLLLL